MEKVSVIIPTFNRFKYLLKAIESDCVYVQDICFYYDDSHGDGQNY